ncbi:cobra-like protein 4 [Quercus suber]|uniref:COBRA-like protein n=1 Tax=Quercus suber TaxID=58331 RepID=A0AAW0KXN5_QUESU
MEFNNHTDPIEESMLDARDCSQRRQCYVFPELKFMILAVLYVMMFSPTEAYDPLDPTGNITIKWDVMSWTPDGYVAAVTMNNFQMYRGIMNPGWTLGWSWAKKEVIWTMVSVGLAGTSNKTVKLPKNFTLLGPGPGYTCGPAKIVPSTVFLTSDKRRKTQALMTWNVTCTYSQFLASKNPSCCVSFSSFYNQTITPCPSCACGCQNKKNCIKSDSKLLRRAGINTPKKDNTPLLQCTHHMCPIRVHWHVKLNYKDYWRVKVAVTNFNYRLNYSQWTLVAQHPNLNNVTQVFSFDYKPLVAYESINDTGMFFGMKFYNDLLMEAGPLGNVQSEVLLRKDKDTFTFKQGWAFPRKVYFNGDECMLPPPDTYPFLPNSAYANPIATPTVAAFLLLLLSIW